MLEAPLFLLRLLPSVLVVRNIRLTCGGAGRGHTVHVVDRSSRRHPRSGNCVQELEHGHANTRVLLELVLDAFKRGESAEAIVRSYRSLQLTDVCAVISRYLADPEAVYRKLEAAGMVGRISTQELLNRARAKGLCP